MSVTGEQIIQALKGKGVSGECPMCRAVNQWQAEEGFTHAPMSDDPRTIELKGNIIPLVVLVCVNCGFLSQHSPQVLGLIHPKGATS